jgi:hypothetical protein
MMKTTPYPQGVDVPITSSAIFMVATIAPALNPPTR